MTCDYEQLQKDLEAAKAAAEKVSVPDVGSHSKDSLTLQIPRARRARIKAAIEAAGLSCFYAESRGCFFIDPPGAGVATLRLRKVEAMAAVLKKRPGYYTSVHYQMD